MATEKDDVKPNYLEQLRQYKESREKNPSTFYSFLGKATGFSRAVKLCAVKKLIIFLETTRPQSMQDIEWNALHDGKLGDIVNSMKKNSFDFSSIRKTENANTLSR